MINVDFIDSSEVTTERIYQWDIGRKLKISNIGSAVAPVVHFCNKKSKNALAVESITSDDFYIASIPNSLLQEEYDIIAYIYVGSEEEAKTIKVVHIPVTKRLKPETYVVSEDENVIDFLAISAEMKSLLNGLVITEYDSTKSYIKPNIVYYKGCSYICKSETTISNILPTDTTNWGLMCESGANISQITFSNDTLHFKLQDNTIVDVPLGSIEISTVNPVAFNITEDENGVLKIGDDIISRKKLIWSDDNGVGENYGGFFSITLDRSKLYQLEFSVNILNTTAGNSTIYYSYEQSRPSKFIKQITIPLLFKVDYESSAISTSIFLGSVWFSYASNSISFGATSKSVDITSSDVKNERDDYETTVKLYKIYEIIE